MLKSEFKAARSAHRLMLRNAYSQGRNSFSKAFRESSKLMQDCDFVKRSLPVSMKVLFFKTDRLGYEYSYSTGNYSKKAA